ncbi:MAG TPA: glycosyltransferase, partial [Geminicoccaceae bacterium]|nr:glycosyltransferase [Geminicoccaceae bacterium]
MLEAMQPTRLLIYSHDSFGLGHLRRCRAIAHHLVETYRHLSVLILSGSPIIGSFDFKSRVDFVRVPGVIKLRNAEYTSLQLHIDIEQTLAMRSSIIQHTADIFDPHLFLVDKEPLGLRGEVRSTLESLKRRGVPCVLGLRDVMDEPASLVEEWERKGVFPALDELYDAIWVYGLPEIFDPLSEIPRMDRLADKLSFTGYLRREASEASPPFPDQELPEPGYILVTTGGGGDGEDLTDWVIRAYEHDPGLETRALLVFGPFMPAEQRAAFHDRVAHDPRLSAVTFEAHVEPLFERAAAVVAMGGYNTFCEILSFGKRALIVPRTRPRMEQQLRAERAARVGLVRMLPDDGARDPALMAAALRELPHTEPPGAALRDRFLGGLERIAELSE